MKQVEKKSGSRASGILRKRIQQCISVGVCLALGLSAAGCGGKSGKAAETIAADSVFYSAKDLDFYEIGADQSCYVMSMTACNDKIAVLINVTSNNNWVYEGTAEAKTAAAETAAAETTAAAEETVPEETVPEETAAGETTAEEPIIVDGVDISDKEGLGTDNATYVSEYYVLMYDKTGALTATINVGADFDANTYLMNIAVDANGNLSALVQKYDEVKSESSNFLYSFNADGQISGDPVKLTFQDATFYPSTMRAGSDGTVYFGGYNSVGASIVALDSSGKQLFAISDTGLQGNLYQIGDKMYVDGYDQENYKYQFFEIDKATGKLGNAIDMSKMNSDGSGVIYAGTDGIYSSDAYGVNTLDIEKNEKTQILKWKDTDIKTDMNGSRQVAVLSADTILMIQTSFSYTDGSATVTASLLTRQSSNPNAGKEIITIAGVGIIYDSSLLSAVYNFNKTSTEYRIEIRDYAEGVDYSSAETQEDYMKIYNAMISSMNLEILNGEGPDILYGSYNSFSTYEDKGLFVDLYTLMDKDKSFKKDDYLPSVFKMCENDGHLYKMGIGFYINGLMGAKSVIGDRTGWTVDEFNEMVNSLPSGMKPLSGNGYTQSSLLTYSLSACMDTFIHSEDINFDSDEFCQLLDYAKTYGSDDDATDDGGNYVDESELIKNHELALMQCWIGDPSSYYQMAQIFGEPVSVTGFPTPDKSGPLCTMNSMFAISSSSANIDACWEFSKIFLSEDVQGSDNYSWQIPVLKTAFEAQIDKAMNPDQNSAIVYKGDGSTVQAMTEEEAQNYRDLVNSLDTISDTDSEVMAVITEEVPAYFNDQKADKDVASLIQNRVETIIKERG